MKNNMHGRGETVEEEMVVMIIWYIVVKGVAHFSTIGHTVCIVSQSR